MQKIAIKTKTRQAFLISLALAWSVSACVTQKIPRLGSQGGSKEWILEKNCAQVQKVLEALLHEENIGIESKIEKPIPTWKSAQTFGFSQQWYWNIGQRHRPHSAIFQLEFQFIELKEKCQLKTQEFEKINLKTDTYAIPEWEEVDSYQLRLEYLLEEVSKRLQK